MDTGEGITPVEAFRLARQIAGTTTALARRIGMSQQRISYRLLRGLDCPPEAVLTIEREFGISKHLLRPDVYGTSPAHLTALTAADGCAECDTAPISQRSDRA